MGGDGLKTMGSFSGEKEALVNTGKAMAKGHLGKEWGSHFRFGEWPF